MHLIRSTCSALCWMELRGCITITLLLQAQPQHQQLQKQKESMAGVRRGSPRLHLETCLAHLRCQGVYIGVGRANRGVPVGQAADTAHAQLCTNWWLALGKTAASNCMLHEIGSAAVCCPLPDMCAVCSPAQGGCSAPSGPACTACVDNVGRFTPFGASLLNHPTVSLHAINLGAAVANLCCRQIHICPIQNPATALALLSYCCAPVARPAAPWPRHHTRALPAASSISLISWPRNRSLRPSFTPGTALAQQRRGPSCRHGSRSRSSSY